MSTEHRHRITTVRRGEGYAARCEYEQGGVTYLCSITFGGYPTRTAARRDCEQAHDRSNDVS